jgi:hypothetical protein
MFNVLKIKQSLHTLKNFFTKKESIFMFGSNSS